MERQARLAIAFALTALVCSAVYASGWGRPSRPVRTPTPPGSRGLLPPDDRPAPPGLQKATFAAGCFWCVEAAFDRMRGVVSTTAGYTGGALARPSYEEVSAGGTGHVEAVEVLFDPRMVSYEDLLAQYWKNVDPFNDRGQFCDYGEQYRPVIFAHSPGQRRDAALSRAQVEGALHKPVAVAVVEGSAFYPAEAYHQNYRVSHPVRYGYYTWACGRAQRLREVWTPF